MRPRDAQRTPAGAARVRLWPDNATGQCIDILLKPDARMLQHAERHNARVRGAFPEGLSSMGRPARPSPPASGAAVYQRGAVGTAAKKLKEWDLKP